jgi:hypothetical protein
VAEQEGWPPESDVVDRRSVEEALRTFWALRDAGGPRDLNQAEAWRRQLRESAAFAAAITPRTSTSKTVIELGLSLFGLIGGFMTLSGPAIAVILAMAGWVGTTITVATALEANMSMRDAMDLQHRIKRAQEELLEVITVWDTSEQRETGEPRSGH